MAKQWGGSVAARTIGTRLIGSGSRLRLGAGLGAAALLTATALRDARRVANDPARAWLTAPPEGRKVDVASADGTRLHVDVLGPDDAPTVVLIHGWTCSREFWAPQLTTLAKRHRLVAYDLRGHGRSDAPGHGDFSAEALADDLAAVLAATVPSGQKALLVGHSLGAMSIVSWAGRHAAGVRERVAAAMLVSTGTSDLVTESLILKPPAGLSKAVAVISRQVMAAAVPYGFRNPMTHRIVRHVALSKAASPAQVAFCERIVLDCDRRWRAATARTLSRLDLDAALRHLDVPTLVLGGSADRLTPPVLSERLAELLPRLIERIELPGVGHMSPVEAPQAVNDLIDRMVAEHLGRRPASAPLTAAR
ncbi:MAG TPA: alpha/beta hydrolase [Frankiaceae bacterium]|nr:alpha/beta hydrolase [Frankiaceae bacterium]